MRGRREQGECTSVLRSSLFSTQSQYCSLASSSPSIPTLMVLLVEGLNTRYLDRKDRTS